MLFLIIHYILYYAFHETVEYSYYLIIISIIAYKFFPHFILDCFDLVEDYDTKLVSLVNSSIILLICFLTSVGYPLCLLMHHIWKKSRRLQRAMQAVRVYFQRSANDNDSYIVVANKQGALTIGLITQT